MGISLNHIHLVTNDKYKLADWYCQKLDFQIVEDIEKLGEKNGPLVISGDGGKSGISIFNNKSGKENGTTVIPAFHVDKNEFVKLHKQFSSADQDIVIYDHLIFCSFYIKDPDASVVEITNSQYKELLVLLKEQNIKAMPMSGPVELK